MIPSASVDSLLGSGLTGLEARVCVLLLEAGPATGHRVARALGKTAASIYKTDASDEPQNGGSHRRRDRGDAGRRGGAMAR